MGLLTNVIFEHSQLKKNQAYTKVHYSDTSANEDNSFRNHIP